MTMVIMPEHVNDELSWIMRVHPYLGELLPRAVERAYEHGSGSVDNWHCMIAILREEAESPIVKAALCGVEAAEFERALLDEFEASRPTEVHRISPRLWYMIYSAGNDTFWVGILKIRLAHVLLFFLTRPACMPYGIWDKLKIDRQKAIAGCVQASEFVEKDCIIAYYTGLHDVLQRNWALQCERAQIVEIDDWRLNE